MNITEIRVKLLEGRADRLRAFCSITLDEEFVVHDLRVIDGRKGLFVAMPSRKLSDNCPRCGGKNHLRAKFCSECGAKLDEDRGATGPGAREKFHVDVAHPINPSCRELIQSTVLSAYRDELDRVAEGLAPSCPYETPEAGGLGDDYFEGEVRETEPAGAAGRVMEEQEEYSPDGSHDQEEDEAGPAEQEQEEYSTDGSHDQEEDEVGPAEQEQEQEQEREGGFGAGLFG